MSKKHGRCGTPEYQSWHHMVQRCTNPNNDRYHSYGGRGIKVCKEWLQFKQFYADMGKRPKGYSIDRIDNNLGYFKENCRWATQTEQSRNRGLNKNNKTGIKGIFWAKRDQKYRVDIKVNYKSYFIGFFQA